MLIRCSCGTKIIIVFPEVSIVLSNGKVVESAFAGYVHSFKVTPSVSLIKLFEILRCDQNMPCFCEH